MRLSPTTIFYSVLPMFHMMCASFSFGCLALGVTNVLEQRYTTELLLDTVQRRKVITQTHTIVAEGPCKFLT